MRTGEQWAKSLGCTELASDAELDNVDSHDFHKKIGFHEAGRIVAFIKKIDNADPTQLQEWNGLSRNQAEDLIKTYFHSWIEKNFEQFTSVIHDEAIVRECTGAVIEGKAELHRWFKEWNDSGNQVVFWKIHTIGYDKERTSAFVEWTFKCIFEEQEYEWDGCSMVHFRDSLIVELNEYEMKREKFHPYRNKQQKWDVKL